VDSNAAFYGTIYAPKADIRIDSNARFYGAMAGKSIDIDSNAGFHYDEALGRMSSAQPTITVVSWRYVEGGP
jgi:hypothetical protein